MSGSETSEEDIARILDVFSRSVPVPTLASVASALNGRKDAQVDPNQIAFGLDTNVILTDLHDNDSSVADYLSGQHEGLLVVPSQVVQEFWNNRLSMNAVAPKLQTAYDNLVKVVSKLDGVHEAFKGDFEALLARFEDDTGHVWSDAWREKVATRFGQIATKAVEPAFPKHRLAAIALERDRTKTPPGFEDPGNGDLYVWAEYLLALMQAKREGADFELAVLVTDDKKRDWGLGGEAHPVLIAELRELVGVPFETWSIHRLRDHVDVVTA